VAGCHSDPAPPVQDPPDAGAPLLGGEVPPGTGLPPLPLLTRTKARMSGNTATLSFEPLAAAKDYRVYVLPDKASIRLGSDGTFDGIDNGTYRCAGQRAAPRIWVDKAQGPASNPVPDWIATRTLVDGQEVEGYTRSLSEATLGYAFQDPQDGTVPIYAMGDPSAMADNYQYGVRETQTRAKAYVGAADRTALLAQGFRDDGVAFYAPASASSTACGGAAPTAVSTRVYVDKAPGTSPLYYSSAQEKAARGAGKPAFLLCPNAVSGALPVMRVYYAIASPGGIFGGAAGHDELALGQARFDRARCMGSEFAPCADVNRSPWEVTWSNVTEETQLIVEALDAPCPFQGLLAFQALPSTPVGPDDNSGDNSLMNDPFFTLAQLRAAAPHGEVYLNGQGAGGTAPKPIARSAIKVSPAVRPAMQFASDFVGKPEVFHELLNADGSPNCRLTKELRDLAGNPDTCDTSHAMDSTTYDVLLVGMHDDRYSVGVVEGELWTGYSGDKFRISPKNTPATMSDTAYLHAAMEVTAFATGRRYPQIIISQQDFITSQWLVERSIPVNPNIKPLLLFHPIDSGVGRPILELELCNQRHWAVNDHCPWFLLEKNDPPKANTTGANNPHPDLFDRLQDDRVTRFDLYVSTQKAYVFLDSLPYACVDLAHRKAIGADGTPITPTPAPPPAGPVTVTFGDVLYHPGAESGYFTRFSLFHADHLAFETARHFDYLGFNSNEAQPAWDESVFPCITQMYQGGNAGTQAPEP
jgi:hypothetical protein